MFRSIRMRLKRTSSKDRGDKDDDTRRFVFRSNKTIKQYPSVEPALTYTLSQDEKEEMVSTPQSLATEVQMSPPVKQMFSSSYMFSEEDLMANELNHMRRLVEKQSEITTLETVHNDLTQRLATKDAELANVHEKLENKDRELQEVYQELSVTDDELIQAKLELSDAKDELNAVSSALIQCQHQLHEQASKCWPW